MKKLAQVITFLIFIFSTKLFAETIFDLTIQPYNATEFFVNGIKTVPKLIALDKTIATVQFTLKDDVSLLEIKNPCFRPISLKKTLQLKKYFIVLSPKNSSYDVEKIFSTGNKPKSVTFLNENTVSVALLDGNGIDIINIEDGKTHRISPPKEYAEKCGFVEGLVLKEKQELWISQMTTACIHIFDLNSFQYKRTIKTSGKWSKVMAYNPITDRVYLSNWQTCDISIINPNTCVEEKKVKTKTVPRGMSFSHDGKFIYCALFEDATGQSDCQLIKKELDTFKTVAQAGKRGAKRHIVTDYINKKLYVSDMRNSTIEIYSLSDDTLIKTVKVFNNPNTIQLSPDGKFLYVSCRGPNNPKKGYLYKGLKLGRLDIIDTTTMTLIESIEAGNQPTGLDVSPDGSRIVLSDFLDNRIRIFRPCKIF